MDVARHAHLTARTRSLSLYRFDNGFGHALGIDAASEAISAGYAEAMERGSPLRCLSFFFSLAWRFAEEKGQHEWKRMDMCRDGWKDRWTSLVCIYSYLYR